MQFEVGSVEGRVLNVRRAVNVAILPKTEIHVMLKPYSYVLLCLSRVEIIFATSDELHSKLLLFRCFRALPLSFFVFVQLCYNFAYGGGPIRSWVAFGDEQRIAREHKLFISAVSETEANGLGAIISTFLLVIWEQGCPRKISKG